MNMAEVKLLGAFMSFESCRVLFEKLKETLDCTDPAVAVLALEGLYRIERDFEGRQFNNTSGFKNLLRRWRCESPLGAYDQTAFDHVSIVHSFLRNLTVFIDLGVPLFVDNYGVKKLLSSYGEGIEDIDINGDTPIYHVTHSEEADSICKEQQLRPSANKNIIKGCWFGLESPEHSGSLYGNRSFKTTLSQLGVTCLHQGEIVAYKKEVNVILYAADDPDPLEYLKKPTAGAVKEADSEAYVKVSVFVPARFLPSSDKFSAVISGPFVVKHGGFCIRAAREKGDRRDCDELDFYR